MAAMIGSLDNPPNVIRQLRRYIMLALPLGLFALPLGLTAIIACWHGHRPDFFLLVFGLLFTYAGAIFIFPLFRPAQLTISPEGLSYRVLWSHRFSSWADVRGIGIWSSGALGGGIRGVRIISSNAKPINLAGCWPLSRNELGKLIEQAWSRWQ